MAAGSQTLDYLVALPTLRDLKVHCRKLRLYAFRYFMEDPDYRILVIIPDDDWGVRDIVALQQRILTLSINCSRITWVWSRFSLLHLHTALCILKWMYTLCLALSHDVGCRMSCTFLTSVTQLGHTWRKTLEHFSCYSTKFLSILHHI